MVAWRLTARLSAVLLVFLAPGARADWGIHKHNDTKYCGGVTKRHGTEWYEATRNEADDLEGNVRGLSLDIDTSMCEFKNPVYIASIIGTRNAGTLFRCDPRVLPCKSLELLVH